jgi:hypothetical protein
LLDLFDELCGIVACLEKANIEFALCGGLAVAVYSTPRFTEDIDLLVPPASIESVKRAVKEIGFIFEAAPMGFAEGTIIITRLSKIDHPRSSDLLLLNILTVTPLIQDVWDTRVKLPWEQGTISVVSKEGLIKLKKLRNSPQDLVDIKALE